MASAKKSAKTTKTAKVTRIARDWDRELPPACNCNSPACAVRIDRGLIPLCEIPVG